jgi:hypothetical protein
VPSVKEKNYQECLRFYLHVLFLRSTNKTYQEIAEILGLTRQRIHRIAKCCPYPMGRPRVASQQISCAVEGCTQVVAFRKLCPKHYAYKFRRVISEGDTDLLAQIEKII